jgi:hypothetical protein
VKEIQIVAMEIMRSKPSQIWCTIEHIKQHHEDHKHESFYLIPNLFLDFICNPKHELKLDLWESKQFRKEKTTCKKGKENSTC